MAKRFSALLAAVYLMVLFSACSGFGVQNVNDLLRAPALGDGAEEIQKALVSYLDGQEPQYKFPKAGDWRSPLVRTDLNGDGVEEAIILYSVADTAVDRGNYVYMALLSQQEGSWQVIHDVPGLSSEVESLEVADLLGNSGRQLIVGFTTSNFNRKTYGLYTMEDNKLQLWYKADYSRYEIGDFTGQGKNDLVVVSSDDVPGNLQLQYIPTENGSFAPPQEPVNLERNFLSCAGITPSLGPNEQRIIIVDGFMEKGLLYSQFVYFNGERFYTVDDSGALRGASARRNSLLLTRDIDSDGYAEIPLRVSEIQTPGGDKRLEYIEWVDFTNREEEPVVKQFGMLDSDRAVYIRLPDDWRSKTVVSDGEQKGEWQILRRESKTPLVSLKVLESGDTLPVGAQRVLGSVNSYLVVANSVSEEDRAMIEMVQMQVSR